MNDFADFIDKQLRLAALRLLKDAPGYSANTAVLQTALGSLGFNVSRAKVDGECDWLKEQSLVTINEVGSVKVIKITQRGVDVASGFTTITGVDRPSPKG